MPSLATTVEHDKPGVGASYDTGQHVRGAGDEVEVVGTIEQTPDARRESLPREMHTRPVLVSTPEQQLTVQLLR